VLYKPYGEGGETMGRAGGSAPFALLLSVTRRTAYTTVSTAVERL